MRPFKEVWLAWLSLALVSVFTWFYPPIHVHAQAVNTWTAKVLDQTQDGRGNSTVTVHFADNFGHFLDMAHFVPLGAASTDLADWVAMMESQLLAQVTAANAVPSIGSTITPTPETAIVNDPNASVKATFLSDYLLLREYQTALSHGLITSLDAGLVAQQAKVNSEFAANRAILLPLIDVGP